jgi:NAD(P)-dependent dehydrogenase (short-subunit alcohol dehydrogenase family)
MKRLKGRLAIVTGAASGIRVSSIRPGFIATPILEQARNTPLWDGMTALTPMGHLGDPADVAAGVAYLASDDAAFVTGSELYVDGGFIAR